MSVRRHRLWYIATIRGLSACSKSRPEAQGLVIAMFYATLALEKTAHD